MTTVALIGIGRMGGAMARSLARAGADLVLWNRTPDRAEALARELGARVAASAAEAVSAADVSISMLANEAAVEAVYSGPDGLLAGAGPGLVLVDSSTVPPDVIRSLEARARATGAGILDAPVSGSVTLAQSGQLTLMVGGDAADLERARPALEPLAKTIFHMGALGSGAAVKLAVNTLVFGLNQALAEGIVLAEAAGVDPALAWDVFQASTVGSPFVGYKRAAFLDPDGTPPVFGLDLAEKDLRLITGVGRRLDVPMPQAAANLAAVRAAAARLGASRDFADVAVHLRRIRSRAAAQVARGGGGTPAAPEGHATPGPPGDRAGQAGAEAEAAGSHADGRRNHT